MLRSRALQAFVAIFVVGGLLAGVMLRATGLSTGQYYSAVLAVAVVAGLALAQGPRLSAGPARGQFLCDNCKYNDPRYCGQPQRPNATECEEFRSR